MSRTKAGKRLIEPHRRVFTKVDTTVGFCSESGEWWPCQFVQEIEAIEAELLDSLAEKVAALREADPMGLVDNVDRAAVLALIEEAR